jgi:hypothetical protein
MVQWASSQSCHGCSWLPFGGCYKLYVTRWAIRKLLRGKKIRTLPGYELREVIYENS